MKKYACLSILSCCVILLSCKQKAIPENLMETIEPRTPVTVTEISYEPIEAFVELNATATYLQKNIVKSNLNGYIQKSNIRFGDFVNRGQVLFVLKTKEAAAIGNSVNQLNPEFKFSGENVVRADASGYVSEVNHQSGDYVQDGEQLAVINDERSFVFVMNVPYEYRQYASIGKQVQLMLPDKENLYAVVQSTLPMMDSLSQTQAVSLKVKVNHPIPVNLVARVKIVKDAKTAAQTLQKSAVLSDETQSDFWIMKIINDSTAVKVPVKTGIETGNKVEIISPQFAPRDKIIITGNYGLTDTASVTITTSGSAGKED